MGGVPFANSTAARRLHNDITSSTHAQPCVRDGRGSAPRASRRRSTRLLGVMRGEIELHMARLRVCTCPLPHRSLKMHNAVAANTLVLASFFRRWPPARERNRVVEARGTRLAAVSANASACVVGHGTRTVVSHGVQLCVRADRPSASLPGALAGLLPLGGRSTRRWTPMPAPAEAI
jgi:hypothetical protein